MIRRNHIEKITRIERHTIKYDVKQPQRQSNSKRYDSRRGSDSGGEECLKVTSSNKKYHQYKDWKDHNRNKLISNEIKEIKTPAQPLRQFSTNENKPTNTLSRNYQYQPDQKALQTRSGTERNYSSITTYDKERQPINTTTVNYECNRPAKTDYNEVKPIAMSRYDNYTFQGINLQNKMNDSPNRRKLSYQSTQKYDGKLYSSNSQGYTPLFQSIPCDNRESSNRQRRPQLRNSAKATGKIICYQNSFKSDKEQPTFRNYKTSSFVEPKLRQSSVSHQTGVAARTLPVNEQFKGGEQVSSKLKKISEFNDQINERIKNIIVCFESLKNKF